MKLPGTRTLAKHMAGRAIATQLGAGRYLDFGLGIALARDSRVPMKSKAFAVALSAAAMTGLVALELPLEGILALAMPFLGGAVDLAIDGAEETVGTLMVSALVLQYLAPRELVEQIRAERAGLVKL